MYNIFVDGQHGTTGLKIHEYLLKHPNVKLLNIDYEKRRDIKTRKEYINNADLVFLCLPDNAAREAVTLVENNNTKIIDSSTAHRTMDEWAYGIPELYPNQRDRIKNSNRVTVPGCHATASIIALAPLVKAGIVPPDYPVSIFSVTGYSGGGKEMIAKYEDDKNEYLKIPMHYALRLNHKHLPEIKKYSGLTYEPIFMPVTSNYYKGLAVSIPLYTNRLAKYTAPKDICRFLTEYYAEEKFVKVIPFEDESLLLDGRFNITGCNNTNMVEIFVFGNEDRIMLITRLDNLGKGASGAAVQNMNIILGIKEETGLV
ncbi:N-acetyl-gamma-glutamyl-phosphate reductase [Clostridium sp.]|jgi:N-acetyl-gamma-glutamyl-phosphate reductase|uniref:N-acetyl-gamma-glutamyl-phosphate reductase n=1 Tax=Clostridium sp. TaxID=1506 RepID=UPI002584DAD3|nr:N-acetyl-gamma-glutamyl-phosphate reductase [Clostridium sp.]MDF2505294.1 N-acetyl-gamma-glutamyl-phosphate reductase, uncommon form [Clostridium sp.]